MDSHDQLSAAGEQGTAARQPLGRFLHLLYRELVLRWKQDERSDAVIAIGYGVYLYLAQSFGSAPAAFSAMDHLAKTVVPYADPEAAWGSLMIIIGVATALGLVAKGVQLRQGAGFTRAALWLLMAACFFASNPRSPAIVVYAVLGWGALTRAWNARRAPDGQPEP